MTLLLGIAGVLAAAAAVLFFLRRRAASSPAAAGSDAGPSGAEPAWASRITQAIPAIARRAAAEHADEGVPGRSGVGLQGNLAQTPLHDLLQFLALGRKTGVLELASGRRAGRIILAGGRIAHCEYRGKRGMEAAFLMLDLADGDFEFLEPAEGAPEPSAPPGAEALEAVDAIMLWMARKPKKKPA